ncbi:MAG: hypothetical protein ACI9HG_001143, partial [Flavobacteriales bacterium]
YEYDGVGAFGIRQINISRKKFSVTHRNSDGLRFRLSGGNK